MHKKIILVFFISFLSACDPVGKVIYPSEKFSGIKLLLPEEDKKFEVSKKVLSILEKNGYTKSHYPLSHDLIVNYRKDSVSGSDISVDVYYSYDTAEYGVLYSQNLKQINISFSESVPEGAEPIWQNERKKVVNDIKQSFPRGAISDNSGAFSNISKKEKLEALQTDSKKDSYRGLVDMLNTIVIISDTIKTLD